MIKKLKFLCLAGVLLSSIKVKSQTTESRIIGYLPAWGNVTQAIDQTDFSGLSHVMFAFANPDMQGNISFGTLSSATIQNLVDKAHDAGCQVLISIGGGNPAINPAWQHNMKQENRDLLNQNLISLMNEYRFDGIDVDLEGDLVLSANYAGYVASMDELLPQHKLLTAALATWSASNLSKSTLDRYDFINVMSYDQKGPWTPNSPGQHSSLENAASDIRYWINAKGISPDRVVLGVPFYGYNFESSSNIYSMTYKEIVAQHDGAEELDEIQTIYYNGLPTIKAKAKMAIENAGGIMIWEITQDVSYDDDRSLLKGIHSVISPLQSDILTIDGDLNQETVCYPVPADAELTLEGIDTKKPIAIVDLDGKVVWNGSVDPDSKINVSSLRSGIYGVIFTRNGKKDLIKMIKK